MTTIDTLRAARAYLSNPENWFKGHYGKGGQATCMVGAVKLAVGYRPQEDSLHNMCPSARRAAAALQRTVGGDPRALRDIFAFNDSPSTTHAAMLAVFDRAIADEEAKAQEFTVEPITESEHVVA